MHEPPSIDADITRARTLPAWFYRSPEVHAWAIEHVLARSWQFTPDIEHVRSPQQVRPFEFLPGSVPEPLLLTRDRDDRLHCVSNVCTHRGALVVTDGGRVPRLRCPYHGRCFSLDGRFERMPEFERTCDFPTAADDLRALPLESFGRFLLTAIDPVAPFEALFGPMAARCGHLAPAHAILDPTRSRDYVVSANWMLYCENYLEGFHIPFVHASLEAVLDYGAYRTECFEWSSVQLGIAGGEEDLVPLPKGHPDEGARVAGYYWWVFPNLMFNLYPWGISVNIVQPLAVDRTRIRFLAYVADPAALERGAGAGLDRVEREDEVIVESVQRGIASRIYTHGRYSPTREQGVHHFHRLLAARFTATAR